MGGLEPVRAPAVGGEKPRADEGRGVKRTSISDCLVRGGFGSRARWLPVGVGCGVDRASRAVAAVAVVVRPAPSSQEPRA